MTTTLIRQLLILTAFLTVTAMNVFGQTSKKDISISKCGESFIIAFGKATGKDSMTFEEIQKIDSLSITDLKGNKCEYLISGFNISRNINGIDCSEASANNKLTDKQKQIIRHMPYESIFYIEHIRVSKNGVLNKTEGCAITIKIIMPENKIITLTNPETLTNAELDHFNTESSIDIPREKLAYKLMLNNEDTAYFFINIEEDTYIGFDLKINSNPYYLLPDKFLYSDDDCSLADISVSFFDINSDGYTDIIVLAQYKMHSWEKYETHYAHKIYLGSKRGFYTKQPNSKIFPTDNLKTIEEIKKEYTKK